MAENFAPENQRNKLSIDLTSIIQGLFVVLLGAGVIGIFTMNSRLAKLEETVAGWNRQYEYVPAELRDHEQRITRLESEISPKGEKK